MNNKDLLSLPKDEFMRRKIIAAIRELLRHTSFQKLTVTSVCEQADISRSSFYHLFSDISDALDWDAGQLFSAVAEKYPFCTDWRADLENQLMAYMDARAKESAAYKKIAANMSLVDPGSIYQRTCKRRTQLFLNLIETWQGKPADERCAFEIEFYVCGESMAVTNWARSMKESTKTVAKNIVGCMPVYLGQVLDTSFAAYQKRLADGSM